MEMGFREKIFCVVVSILFMVSCGGGGWLIQTTPIDEHCCYTQWCGL